MVPLGVEALEGEALTAGGGPPIRLSGRPRGLRAPSDIWIRLRKCVRQYQAGGNRQGTTLTRVDRIHHLD